MLKIPSKVSISITLVISVLFFAACVVGMFFMPALTDVLIEAHNNSASVARISVGSGDVILGLLFAVFSVAVLTDILLFLLLIRVRGGKSIYHAERFAYPRCGMVLLFIVHTILRIWTLFSDSFCNCIYRCLSLSLSACGEKCY